MGRSAALRPIARSSLVAGLIIALVAFAPGKAEAGTKSSERQMVSMINKARKAAGRPALKMSGYLSAKARTHSAKMMAKDTIFHNQVLPKTLSKIEWNILGENVGMGPTISALHAAFMASPGHKANNLDRRYKKVGVGVTSKKGKLWITVIFHG